MTEIMKNTGEVSSHPRARMAGAFYLLTFVSGSLALILDNGKVAANIVAGLSYIAVTILFYGLFKPVNRNLSMLAALLSLAGCLNGILSAFHLTPIRISTLVFFGFYCLLIGYLVFRSTFMPQILGVLMACGGLGWLTFGFPAFSRALYPWNLAPGIIAEGLLTLWLLFKGVDEPRWHEQGRQS